MATNGITKGDKVQLIGGSATMIVGWEMPNGNLSCVYWVKETQEIKKIELSPSCLVQV